MMPPQIHQHAAIAAAFRKLASAPVWGMEEAGLAGYLLASALNSGAFTGTRYDSLRAALPSLSDRTTQGLWAAVTAWMRGNGVHGTAADLAICQCPADCQAVADMLDEQIRVSGPSSNGVGPRNEWFLAQYDAYGSETYRRPRKIQALWIALSPRERAAICPSSPGLVTKNTVIIGIKRARRLRLESQQTATP